MTDMITNLFGNNKVVNTTKFKKKLYGINLPKFEKQANTSYLKTEKLGCTTVDDGIILPLRKIDTPALNAIYEGGVCDSDFNFIAGHIRNDNGKNNNFEVVRGYKADSYGYLDEEVVFAGVAFDHFGHFIVESMVRIWWIIKNSKFDHKVVFLKNNTFDSSFLELLELIGLKKSNIIYLDKPTQFRKVFIPDQALIFSNHYYEEFSLPYEKILEKIEPADSKKIYLSRTKFRKKDCINEEYFENFYKEMGYMVIYPEQLDLKQQIALVNGADEIVSTIGTISHLALFAKKETKIVTLLRARNFFSNVQAMINQSKKLDYTFIDVTCNFLPSRYSAACYYIGPTVSWNEFVKKEYGLELNINLIDYLNDHNSYVGDYFKQWIKTFSHTKQFNKIKNDTSLDILKNLEIILADKPINFETKSKKLESKVVDKPPSYSEFSNKVFIFSRIDDSYSRKISLNKSGVIETVEGKSNANESFWTIKSNELVFLNREGDITSKYFCNKKKENGLFLLGYYELNKEIIFKLTEID